MVVTRWGDAVKKLLKAAKIPQASLAREVGLHRVVLNRYLEGDRTARLDAVVRINEALGLRLCEPGIEAYLSVLHWAETPDRMDIPDSVVEDGVDMLRSAFISHLREDAAPQVGKALLGLGASRFRKLVLALCAIQRRRSLRRVRGVEDPGKPWFTELQETCAKHGVNLEPWLKTKRELREVRALDAFAYRVKRALRPLSDDPSERLEAEQEIISAGVELAAITRYIEEQEA